MSGALSRRVGLHLCPGLALPGRQQVDSWAGQCPNAGGMPPQVPEVRTVCITALCFDPGSQRLHKHPPSHLFRGVWGSFQGTSHFEMDRNWRSTEDRNECPLCSWGREFCGRKSDTRKYCRNLKSGVQLEEVGLKAISEAFIFFIKSVLST